MNFTSAELKNLFTEFERMKVLIVGDVMLDAYVYGHVERISPEAPVPVLLIEKEEQRPGGAANVAMNVKSMGATPLLVSIIGNDNTGKQLKDMLEDFGITSGYLIEQPGRPTTCKTRILAKGHQMMRLDKEESVEGDDDLQELILLRIQTVLEEEKPDVLIFQDYNKGVLTDRIITAVTMMCLERQIPIAVDPKKRHFFAYQMCTLFKPNLREIKDSIGQDIDPTDLAALKSASEQLREQLHHGITLITLSEKGVYLHTPVEQVHLPATVRKVADVSGAGDTVISVAALCLAAKTSLQLLAGLSNMAGGIVCEYPGVVTIEPQRLLKEATRS